MRTLIARFAKDESGATAIEYGLIITLLSLALLVALTTMGGNLNNKYVAIGNMLK